MTAVVATHTWCLKAEPNGKKCFQNFARVIEFSDTLLKLTAFQSFARMRT